MKNNRDEKRKVVLPSREEVARERDRLRYRQRFRRALLVTAGILIVVAAVSVLISTRLLPVLQVAGDSMEPTMEDGEIVILRTTDDLETGDLVAFYYQSRILLKRVIGTAGDRIDIDKSGNVSVNGERIEEPYVTGRSLGECDIELPYRVPEGQVFVMGDHRSVSVDSRVREVGCVSQEQVIGEVVFLIWPLNRAGFLN